MDRKGGTSLHETYAIDLYGSESERAALRKLDTDTCWQDVKLEWIEHFSGVGGLVFFNEIALRYYTPAYFRWYFERDHLSESMETTSLVFNFTLSDFDLCDLDRGNGKKLQIFSPPQARTIREFFEHMLQYNPDQGFFNRSLIETSIAKFWNNREIPLRDE